MKDRVLSSTEFRARCLACLHEIELSGESITVTRRGRAIAVLGPVPRPVRKSPRNSWARKARIEGDIVNPAGQWEVAS